MKSSDKSNYLLSVVVLTKNSARTLNYTLESLLKSTIMPDELIIVDGGSTDSTLSIVKSYMDKLDVRIVYDKGRGYGYARDLGWRSSRGKYVVMVDSDVVVNPEFFQRAIEILEKDSGLAALAAKLRPVVNEKGLLAKFQTKNLAIIIFNKEDVYPKPSISVSTSCTIYRKSALESVNGFSHKFVLAKEDSDITFRLIKNGFRASQLKIDCKHLETGKRFFKVNFKYGRSYPVISSEHPDMSPLWTRKNIFFISAVIFPFLQFPILAWYLNRYIKLGRMSSMEAFEMASIETLRQFLRYSGMLHQLIRGGYT
ncbi:MAG: glycosyltransferase family 2 protein [Nitrososphaeria archaeon]